MRKLVGDNFEKLAKTASILFLSVFADFRQRKSAIAR